MNNSRIARNSLLLYLRMMIVMVINLYAVRIVLQELGIEDYGIYNVIAGFVTTLSGLTSVFTTSVQRFYSIAIGNENSSELSSIFSESLRINVCSSLILLCLAETIGVWFVNTHLVFPTERLFAVNLVYQASLISFICVLIQIPYSAAVIAEEDMQTFALISLSECFMKLCAALLLIVWNSDHLITYSFLLSVVSIIVLSSYIIICKKKYIRYRYTKDVNKLLRKHILSFSGWTLFSSLASVCMYQVNTILVNIFFGPAVNASRAIALQLNGMLSSFTGSFLLAIRPPMMKLYAARNYDMLNRLFSVGNKFIYYFMLMIGVPLFLEMDTILRIWLNHDNAETVLFARQIVVYAIILSLNNPISFIIQATGHVKKYSLMVETITLFCMPATYMLFRMGFDASSTFTAMIVCVLFSHFLRLYCLYKYYSEYPIKEYFFDFLLRGLVLTLPLLYGCYIIHVAFSSPLQRLIMVMVACILLLSIGGFFIGLNTEERTYIISRIRNIVCRNG